MADVDGDIKQEDPMRLCHVCRSPVSALAVRCRFCGATLQRPRKSDEVLTVKDLGGESTTTYRPSTNVMSALEAFAEEEKAQSRSHTDEKEGTVRKGRGRQQRSDQTETRQKMEQALDELDPAKIDIYSVEILSRRPKESTEPPPPKALENLAQKLLLAAAFILGLVILYFVAELGWSWMRSHRRAPQAVSTTMPNRAEAMLAEGQPLLDVHREAIRALQADSSSENIRIIRGVREKLIHYIEGEAYCNPFDMSRISTANRDSTSAATIDFDQKMVELADVMRRETALFKFILVTLDLDAGQAVFRLNNSYADTEEQTVQRGDLLQERFIVTDISSRGVSLEDTHPKAGGRRLIAKTLATVLPD